VINGVNRAPQRHFRPIRLATSAPSGLQHPPLRFAASAYPTYGYRPLRRYGLPPL